MQAQRRRRAPAHHPGWPASPSEEEAYATARELLASTAPTWRAPPPRPARLPQWRRAAARARAPARRPPRARERRPANGPPDTTSSGRRPRRAAFSSPHLAFGSAMNCPHPVAHARPRFASSLLALTTALNRAARPLPVPPPMRRRRGAARGRARGRPTRPATPIAPWAGGARCRRRVRRGPRPAPPAARMRRSRAPRAPPPLPRTPCGAPPQPP
jgi:hypothetical protein